MGTAGTYRFIENLGHSFEVLVIARSPDHRAVYRNPTMPLLPIVGPLEEFIARMRPAISHFAPDIFYVFSSPEWPTAVIRLKELAPSVPVVLDIKTPLLTQNPVPRKNIQKRGNQAVGLVGAIVTPSPENPKSWLYRKSREALTYPLAIDVERIQARATQMKATKPQQWVLVSTLHPARCIRKLLYGFALFLQRNPGGAILDIFGDGPDRLNLERQVSELGLGSSVRFRGLTPQEELFERLPTYDAGIAWVPRAVFDDSPSLKSLEYAAAGLPVLATATRAHLQMREVGFHFEYCDDGPRGVVGGMERLLRQEKPEDVVANLEAVKSHAFPNVVREHILPRLESLMEKKESRESHSEPDASEKPSVGEVPLLPRNGRAIRMMFVVETLVDGKGGEERTASELANEMAKRGHVVFIAYKARDSKAPAYHLSSQVSLAPYGDPKDIKNYLEGMAIDVLVVFYTNENLDKYAAIAASSGVPLVAQESANPNRLLFTNWRRGGVSRSRAIWEREIVTSSASRLRLVMPSYAKSFSPFQQPQIRAMPNSSPRLKTAAIPDQSLNGRWRLLLVNGEKPNNDLYEAVAAFSRVALNYPDWSMRVVGGLSWSAPHAKQVAVLLDKYSLWDRFDNVPVTEDIYEEYFQAHIHLIASRSEGCPLVVLEAMASGLPSIGLEDCAGTNELIRHEVNGLLAKSDDRVEGLAATLEKLMDNPALRSQLGAQAQKDAAEFDPEHTYDLWEELIDDAASYRGEPGRLFREQYEVDPERALHARRMRNRILGHTH